MTDKIVIHYSRFDLPLGNMTLAELDGALCMSDWTSSSRHQRNVGKMSCRLGAILIEKKTQFLCKVASELQAYLEGKSGELPGVVLNPAGTLFQMKVWDELLAIPRGLTVSYSEVARRVGCRSGVRAVASAIAANPLSIFIPCHRVVPSSGGIGNYAGGSEAKATLLALEKQV